MCLLLLLRQLNSGKATILVHLAIIKLDLIIIGTAEVLSPQLLTACVLAKLFDGDFPLYSLKEQIREGATFASNFLLTIKIDATTIDSAVAS